MLRDHQACICVTPHLQVLEYAARWHPQQEVISKTVEGPIVVSTYADLAQRARLCAVALQSLGIRCAAVSGGEGPGLESGLLGQQEPGESGCCCRVLLWRQPCKAGCGGVVL